MSDPYLGLLINIFLMVIAIWSVSEILIHTETRLQATTRRFTKKGKILLFAALAFLTFSFCKDRKNELEKIQTIADQKIKDSITQAENDRRDSVARYKYRESIDKLTEKEREADSTIIKYLVDNGYNVSDLNSRLKTLRDSMVKSEPGPVFQLYENSEVVYEGIKNGLRHYFINYISLDAPSTNYDIVNSLVILDSPNIYRYFDKSNLLYKSKVCPKGSGGAAGFSIPNGVNPIYIYIWMRGTYSNLDLTKDYSIDDIYQYNFKTGITDVVALQSFKDKLISFIKSKE